MHHYFGRDTVINLFISGGSVTAVSFALVAATLLTPESDFKRSAMAVAVSGLITAIAGLIASVGTQVVNILKVIKDHEVVTDDIVKQMNRIQDTVNSIEGKMKESRNGL